jgi:hypothetical protein
VLDGQPEGKTPFQRRIFDITRPYSLTVRSPGYEAHEQMLSASDPWVKKGNVRTLTVSAKLPKSKGGAGAVASPSAEAPAGEPGAAPAGASESPAPAPQP